MHDANASHLAQAGREIVIKAPTFSFGPRVLSGLDELKAVHEELLAEGIGGDLARRLKTTADAS